MIRPPLVSRLLSGSLLNKGPRFDETAGLALATVLDRQVAGHIEPAFRQAAALPAARGVKVHNLSESRRPGVDVFEKRHGRCLCDPAAAQATMADPSR